MKNISLLQIIFLCLLLTGCGTDERERELQGYINQLKITAEQKEVISKPQHWALPKPVVYNPHGYLGKSQTAKITTNPLQSYPLKNLQFVGILKQNNKISGYVMTPDGMLYLVNEGDVIGEDYGKIVKVDTDHIEVIEKTMAGSQSVEKKVELMLKDSPE
jgi:Tfp pilus assembly protein PilP